LVCAHLCFHSPLRLVHFIVFVLLVFYVEFITIVDCFNFDLIIGFTVLFLLIFIVIILIVLFSFSSAYTPVMMWSHHDGSEHFKNMGYQLPFLWVLV
jgi:hypothetical protein